MKKFFKSLRVFKRLRGLEESVNKWQARAYHLEICLESQNKILDKMCDTYNNSEMPFLMLHNEEELVNYQGDEVIYKFPRYKLNLGGREATSRLTFFTVLRRNKTNEPT